MNPRCSTRGTTLIPFDPEYLPNGLFALITGRLDNFEVGGVSIGRAEEFVVPFDFVDFLLRKRYPSLLGKTKESSMQTTMAERHTIYRSLLVLHRCPVSEGLV